MASRKPSQKKRAYGTQLKPQKGENPENRPFLGREKKLSKQTAKAKSSVAYYMCSHILL